jgi:hypothetical protein
VVLVSEDTGELAARWARINAVALEKQAKAEREKKEAEELDRLVDRRNGYWIAAGIFFGVAVGLSILHWTSVLPVPTGVISWLGPGLTVISLLGGIATQVAINHRRTAKKIEDVKDELREEIRDSRPVSSSVLTELVAELQANRALIRQMHDDIGVNERQRQADFDMIRDNSRKALDAVHVRLDGVVADARETLDLMKARDEAYIDLLSALESAASNGHNVLPIRPQPRPRPGN